MKRDHSNRPYIVILSILSAIIVGLIIAIVAVSLDGIRGNTASEDDVISEVQLETSKFFKEDDYDSAIEAYKNKIANTNNDKNKALLYIYLASDLLAYKKSSEEYANQISEYLHLAEQIYPNALSASMLCIYGDNEIEKEKYCKIEEERYLALPESERISSDE